MGGGKWNRKGFQGPLHTHKHTEAHCCVTPTQVRWLTGAQRDRDSTALSLINLKTFALNA